MVEIERSLELNDLLNIGSWEEAFLAFAVAACPPARIICNHRRNQSYESPFRPETLWIIFPLEFRTNSHPKATN
jgi:hypothetical protein